MRRVIVLLLDSFGIGATADADQYGDAGADTFGHIATQCALGKADKANLRKGALHIPHLAQWGLVAAGDACRGKAIVGLETVNPILAKYGFAEELSRGKDTPSGHWEIAGVPVLFEWGYFPPDYPSFPTELLAALIQQGQLPGVLGNCHASGTQIIEELGAEHLKTGKPIVYTSADSVFQIAVHEESFGLQRLYNLCEIARKLVDPYHIGRVIARPFLGTIGHFYRTGNRRDYAIPPPAPTLLDRLVASSGQVIAIGKTADIFAQRGITQTVHTTGNAALFDATLQALINAGDRTLIFTNFVDFDTLYGHRRDVAGYAAALEAFDARLPELQARLQTGDIVIITADHGCDPTWPGSDHTREYIPILAYGASLTPGFINKRDTFADIGQSIAAYLNLPPLDYGQAFF
ncbi:MAG: phosphopentomutase [Gammaproteobacteria bacterium]